MEFEICEHAHYHWSTWGLWNSRMECEGYFERVRKKKKKEN